MQPTIQKFCTYIYNQICNDLYLKTWMELKNLLKNISRRVSDKIHKIWLQE